jgi:hypothetical protein
MPKFLRLFPNSEPRLSQAYVRQKLETGQWGRQINLDKQAPHNELTRVPGKSYLLASVDAQELFDKYAGTGKLAKLRNGGYDNKEVVVADRIIGFAVDAATGNEYPTNAFKIHYSRTKTHIVPKYNPSM